MQQPAIRGRWVILGVPAVVVALGLVASTRDANPLPAAATQTSLPATATITKATSLPSATAKTPPARATTPNAAPLGAASTQTPTAGPIPNSAWQSDGKIDLSQVPDFVLALGRSGQGVVGYIPKAQLFPTSSAPRNEAASPLTGPFSGPTSPTAADIAALYAQSILTVYGPDLTTVVGHMYPQVGFVPLGETPPPPTT
jgi:hypothetical protein